MKKRFLRLVQLSLIVAMGGWLIGGALQSVPVAAQGGDDDSALDAILARAVVKGYFISLKRGTSGSPTLESFYLTEDVVVSDVAQMLKKDGVAAYEITDESPQDDGGFQITATLKPEEYVLTADVNKVTNRWQITGLVWVDGPEDTAMMASDETSAMASDDDEADATTDQAAMDDASSDDASTTDEAGSAADSTASTDETETDTTEDASDTDENSEAAMTSDDAAADDAATTDDDNTEAMASDDASADDTEGTEATDADSADADDNDTEAMSDDATSDDEATTDDTEAPDTNADETATEATDGDSSDDNADEAMTADADASDADAADSNESTDADADATSTEAMASDDADSNETTAAMADSDDNAMAADDAEDTSSAMMADTGEEPTAEIVSVALNVRTGPGFEFDVVTTLKQGDVVDIFGTLTNADRPWYQIGQNDTTLGWISGKPQYVVASGNLDKIPNLSLNTITDSSAAPLETPAETLANATASDDDDASTTDDSDSDASESTEATSSSDTEAMMSGEKPTAEVLSVALNVRKGPGFEFDVVARLRQGEVVDVIGTNVVDERPWYQIVRDGAVLGWISAKSQYVRSEGDTESIPTVPVPDVSSSADEDADSEASNAPVQTAAVVSNAPVTGEKLILQNRSGGEIYLVNAARNDVSLLTSGIDPALSPDGTKLAFTRWASGGDGSIWLYDLNTGSEEQILGETLQAKSPTWSPDGSHIVVNFQEGGRRDVEETCFGLGDRDVPRGAFDIEVKDNGKRICYKLRPDTHWKLRNINVNDRTYEDMASDIYSRSPSWDPAEDWRVVFAGERGLKQLDVNRNVVLPMLDDPRDQGPAFSPDGKQIAVTYSQHQHWEIYTIGIPEGNRNRLTKVSILEEPHNSASPAWSPDGSQIAFITDRTGEWEYWVMNADGSNPRPLLSATASAKISPEYNSVDERLITWGQ
ncbi:MAG: SH3 domain-containing protein [Chloroflexota bacterium]